MKKATLFGLVSLMIVLAGCSGASPSPSVSSSPSPSVSLQPSGDLETGEPDGDALASILGSWDISRAEETLTGEDYSLQELYGTGIQSGGKLVFNADGTFSRYIGFTDGDKTTHEGVYTVSGNDISLEYGDGRTEKAEYESSSGEIKYYLEDDPEMPVTEYYIKAE